MHDLRAVNSQMQAMGALQPGLPNPAMLPEKWHLLIVDLKDCFFTIPLHPEDTQRFAFTLPLINKESPAQRFEWTVLPQGMKNSPTLCQLFVDNALRPVRSAWPNAVIYHYMDDILVAQEHPFTEQQRMFLSHMLNQKGLVVAPEKIRLTAPWKYLGWQISDSQIRPQKLEIVTHICTLHDAQKLMGDLQWLRPVVGISNDDLSILRPLLQGVDPAKAVLLSPQQKMTLQRIAEQITQRWVARRDPDTPVNLTILNGPSQFIGALTQCKKKKGEKIRILEWLYMRLQPQKTIQRLENLGELIRKGRVHSLQITGSEPGVIRLPIKREMLEWCIRQSEELQVSLLSTTNDIVVDSIKSPTLQWISQNSWIMPSKRSETPLPKCDHGIHR